MKILYAGNSSRPLLLLLLFALNPSCGGGGKGGGSLPGAPQISIGKAQGFSSMPLALAPAIDGTGRIYVGGPSGVYGTSFIDYATCLNSDGSLYTGFSTGTGLDNNVRAVAPIPDGSGDLYLGGDFTAYNGTSSRGIVRISSSGTLRSSFAVGTGFDAAVQVITPATDGSGDVFVGGDFQNYNGTATSRIVRLHADGTINATFSIGTGFNSTVSVLVPATDGSGDLYVGGSFTTYNGTGSSSIIRLQSSGAVTTAFNIGTGFNAAVRAIAPAVDGSGDVLVGGDFTTYGGATVNYIVRLHATGAVVSTFSTGTSFNSSVAALVALSDGTGDVVAGGLFTSYNGSTENYLVRLRPDGSVSSALSTGTGFNGSVTLLSLVPGGGGDLYVAGAFTAYNGVGCTHFLRLHADGSVNPSIPTGAGFDLAVRALAPDPAGSGAVTVGGSFGYYNGTPINRLVRLLPSGAIDSSFAVGTGCNGDVQCLMAGAGGTVYVGGIFTSYNGTTCNSLVRLHADGTVDSTFNTGTGFDSSVNAIAAAADGSGDIYCGGAFTTYNGTGSSKIIRLQSTGALASSFSVGTGFNNNVFAVTPLTDGSGALYAGGNFTSYNGTSCLRIVRLQSNGSVDSTFVTGSGFGGPPECVAISPDGSGNVYVGGVFSNYNGTTVKGFVRLQGTGAVDGTFSTGTGFLGTVMRALAVPGGAGTIYVGGTLLTYNGTFTDCGLVRLKPNGSIDAGFPLAGAGVAGQVDALAFVGDGSGDLYAAGSFTYADGRLRGGIVRVGADGTVR